MRLCLFILIIAFLISGCTQRSTHGKTKVSGSGNVRLTSLPSTRNALGVKVKMESAKRMENGDVTVRMLMTWPKEVERIDLGDDPLISEPSRYLGLTKREMLPNNSCLLIFKCSTPKEIDHLTISKEVVADEPYNCRFSIPLTDKVISPCTKHLEDMFFTVTHVEVKLVEASNISTKYRMLTVDFEMNPRYRPTNIKLINSNNREVKSQCLICQGPLEGTLTTGTIQFKLPDSWPREFKLELTPARVRSELATFTNAEISS